MKHALPFLPLILATSVANAQPVLNYADVTPVLGPSPLMAQTDFVAPGPTGANFTFDVSLSQAGATSQSQVMLPSSTPYASYFPQATHSATGLTNPSNYSYSTNNPTSSINLGFYGPTTNIVLSDGEKLFQFPLTYNTTWTDAFAGTGSNSGQSFTRTGSATCSYNGHGTIVMPYGTFTGVIRFELTETITDNFSGLVNIVTQTHTVSYIKPGLPAALFTSSDISTGIDEDPPQPVGAYSIMLDPSEVGISELQGEGPAALLMPNPANEEFSVVMDPAASNGAVSIALLDAMGREVRALQPLAAVVSNRTFNVADLPRGMYLVRIADAQGRVSTSRLVLR